MEDLEQEYIECNICGGTGICVVIEPQCCGYFDNEGYCCGCLIPEQIQEQCSNCYASGYVPNV